MENGPAAEIITRACRTSSPHQPTSSSHIWSAMVHIGRCTLFVRGPRQHDVWSRPNRECYLPFMCALATVHSPGMRHRQAGGWTGAWAGQREVAGWAGGHACKHGTLTDVRISAPVVSRARARVHACSPRLAARACTHICACMHIKMRRAGAHSAALRRTAFERRSKESEPRGETDNLVE